MDVLPPVEQWRIRQPEEGRPREKSGPAYMEWKATPLEHYEVSVLYLSLDWLRWARRRTTTIKEKVQNQYTVKAVCAVSVPGWQYSAKELDARGMPLDLDTPIFDRDHYVVAVEVFDYPCPWCDLDPTVVYSHHDASRLVRGWRDSKIKVLQHMFELSSE